MAEESPAVDPLDLEEDPKKKSVPVWVWALIAALVGLVLIMRPDSDAPEETVAREETGPDAEDGEPVEADGQDFFGAIEVEGPSSDRIVEQFAHQLERQQQRLRELEQRQQEGFAAMEERRQAALEAQERLIDQRMNEITSAIQGLSDDDIRDDFARPVPEDEDEDDFPLPTFDADAMDDPFAEAEPARPRQPEPQPGLQYVSLYEDSRMNLDGEGLEASDFQQPGGPAFGGPDAGAAPESPEPEAVEEEEAPRTDIEISPSSYVEAVNLYGLECPVGRSLGGTMRTAGEGGDLMTTTPALLQIRGQFRGPNQEVVDVGRAHLIGFCEGLRTGESARIRIEQISYVDERGETHVADANGFIVDGRSNDMDVAGTLESDRTGGAVQASALDGLAAIGDLAEQSQFDQATTPEGNQISAFTGNLGSAVGGSFTSGVASRLAELYLADIEAQMDVIHVAAETPMIFNTLEPIVIEGGLPAETDPS